MATFTDLTDDTAGTLGFDFGGGGLTIGPSTSLVVSPAAASQWVVHAQTSPSAVAGQPFAAQPVVYEEDRYGNLETSDDGTEVTATLAVGVGPLQGTITTTVAGGVATFSGLADDKAETIALQFSGGGLAGATANAIAIAAAPACASGGDDPAAGQPEGGDCVRTRCRGRGPLRQRRQRRSTGP